jgi:hypothetical protein
LVEWREVERLRAKGLDWSSIAENPKVRFTPPAGVEDAGRALKSLYLSRKSQRSRSSRGESLAESEDAHDVARRTRSGWLFAAGVVLALLFGIWAVAATASSFLSVVVPVFPYLLGGLIVGLVLLAAAFVLGVTDARTRLTGPIAVGIVVGLVAVGATAAIAYTEGVPNLQAAHSIAFGWQQAPNPLDTSNGRPNFLFVGSAGCPFCSASSWAIRAALQAFGQLSGDGNTTSSPTDTFANTPEVTFYSSSLTSNFVTWQPREDANNQQITVPALDPRDQAYFNAYSSGSIPFVVIGGQYIHVGSLLDPANFCVGGPSAVSQTAGGTAECTNGPVAPGTVDAELAQDPSGTLPQAILAVAYQIEAFIWRADTNAGITPPAGVTGNSQVASDYSQLT